MRREQQALDGARGMVGGDRLARPHVDRGAQAAGRGALDQGVQINHGCAAHDEQDRDVLRPTHQPELAAAEHRLVVGGRGGEDEDDARRAEQLVEAGGLRAGGADRELRQPRVVRAHAAPERGEQPHELAPEVAEPDDADVAAREQEAAAVGDLELVALGAGAHRAVGGGDAAREVDGHAERGLGHRRGERGAGHEHVDTAGEAGLVVDVAQEVALDVDHRPQPRGARDAVGVEVGLADDGHRVGEVGLDDVVGHPARAFMHDEVAEGVEPRARRGVEHGVHRARLGVDQDRRHLRIVDVALFYGERSRRHPHLPRREGPSRERDGRVRAPRGRARAARAPPRRPPRASEPAPGRLQRLPDAARRPGAQAHARAPAPARRAPARPVLGAAARDRGRPRARARRSSPSTTAPPPSTPPGCAGRGARGRRCSAPGCGARTRPSTPSPPSSIPSPTAAARRASRCASACTRRSGRRPASRAATTCSTSGGWRARRGSSGCSTPRPARTIRGRCG